VRKNRNSEIVRIEIETKSIRIWQDGRKEHFIKIDTGMEACKVALGDEEVPDANPEDNVWEKK